MNLCNNYLLNACCVPALTGLAVHWWKVEADGGVNTTSRAGIEDVKRSVEICIIGSSLAWDGRLPGGRDVEAETQRMKLCSYPQ